MDMDIKARWAIVNELIGEAFDYTNADMSARAELVTLLLSLATGVINWQHPGAGLEGHFLAELDDAAALVRRMAEEGEL